MTIDNHVLALDMKTASSSGTRSSPMRKEGYYATGAPIVANGVLISGMAGGESTTRGFLDGWDPDTGKKLWRRYTIPAPGEPGSETWPKNSDAWIAGRRADVAIRLLRSGARSGLLGNRQRRALRSPASRGAGQPVHISVLAIRPKTGEVACYFQYTPNDVYDVDGTDEHVLADIQVDGQPRKVMIQANKNGFMYVLDRTNCKLIAAHPYVKVNWATHIDLATGRPVLTDVYKRFLAGEEVEIWPSRGTNAVPIAFNPNTGLVYASTWNLPRIQKLAPPTPQVIGGTSTGVDATLAGSQARRCARPLHRDQSADRREEMGGAVDGFAQFGRHAGDRRRLDVHRQADGRVHRARRGHRQDAVAVQDRLERQLDGDHLHAQRAAIRDGRVRARRHSRQPLRGRKGADRRLGLDVRAGFRMSNEGVLATKRSPVPFCG